MRYTRYIKNTRLANRLSIMFSILTCAASLFILIYYIKMDFQELSSATLLPILIMLVVVVSVAAASAFLSMASAPGKIAFFLNFCSVSFVIATFVVLYN